MHEADLGDGRFELPEAPGLDAVVRGLGIGRDDRELLELTSTIYDGLFARVR